MPDFGWIYQACSGSGCYCRRGFYQDADKSLTTLLVKKIKANCGLQADGALVKSALAPTVVSVLKLDNDQLNYMAAPQRKAATRQSSAPG
jgi:hypothetical protein